VGLAGTGPLSDLAAGPGDSGRTSILLLGHYPTMTLSGGSIWASGHLAPAALSLGLGRAPSPSRGQASLDTSRPVTITGMMTAVPQHRDGDTCHWQLDAAGVVESLATVTVLWIGGAALIPRAAVPPAMGSLRVQALHYPMCTFPLIRH
jgi:hypothetical protein